MKGYLVLENGEIFEGEKIGYNAEVCCEVVFNTSMAGYIETFTDPSYKGQGIVMTYPLIGNYGVILEDLESEKIHARAVFVHEIANLESNSRSNMSLEEFLQKNKTPGLKGVNTRKLTKILRENGTMRGMLVNSIENLDEIITKIKEFNMGYVVGEVTSKEETKKGEGELQIALLDFGAKENIVRSLVKRGCTVTIFPAETEAEKIINENFDGIMLSNGPGNPEDCVKSIETIKKLYNTNIPILGICLGHQLMGLAMGFKTTRLKYGHRGPNQPVKDLKADRVYITSQNHGYYILEDSIHKETAEISHINLNDGTIEGLRYKNKNIFTVQFHPEACPGPEDTAYIFDEFLDVVRRNKNA